MTDVYARPKHCRGCGEPLMGPWCHACGESHWHGRLSVRALTSEVVDGFLNLDGRVFRTFWGLLARPGSLIRDYLGGRRMPYVHPFKYAIGIVALMFLANELGDRLRGQQLQAESNAEAKQLLLLAMAPVIAVILRRVFGRTGGSIEVDGDPDLGPMRWSEHFVVALYAGTQGILLVTVVSKLGGWLGAEFETQRLLRWSTWLCYGTWVATSTYWSRWWTTIPRVLVVMLLTFLSVGAATIAISPEFREALVEPTLKAWARD